MRKKELREIMRLKMTLRLQIIFLTFIVLLTAFLTSFLLINRQAANNWKEGIHHLLSSTAQTVGNSPHILPWLLEGVENYAPLDDLVNVIETFQGVHFLVVENAAGDMVSLIGNGDVEEALLGLKNNLSFEMPIQYEGEVIGTVFVGKLILGIQAEVAQQTRSLLIAVGTGLLVGSLGAWMIANHIKQLMHHMEPEEIARHLEETRAVMDSVKDGIVTVDNNSNVTFVNGSVHRLFQTEYNTREIEEYIRQNVPELSDVLKSGKEFLQLEKEIEGVAVLYNCIPLKTESKIFGALFTFQDKTELKKLGDRLTDIQVYSDTLRAQSHEFMNKLHVMLGLVQMKEHEKLHAYINQVVNLAESESNFTIDKIKNAVIAGFILGKRSKAREEGVAFTLTDNSFLQDIADEKLVHALIHIMGNLLNNAMEAINTYRTDGRVSLYICQKEGNIVMEVVDNGQGIPRQVRESLMNKNISTKGKHRGFGLYIVKELLDQLGGEIQVHTQMGIGTKIRITIPLDIPEFPNGGGS